MKLWYEITAIKAIRDIQHFINKLNSL